MKPLLLALLGLAGSWGCIFYLPEPFFWTGLLWFALLAYAGRQARKTAAKVICVTLAWIMFTFSLAEGFLWLRYHHLDYVASKKIYAENYYKQNDDILGISVNKNITTRSTKHYGDLLLYDVTYTIDGNGQRISPPFNETGVAGCLLFFGGSFTFGEGVEDKETLPYQVGVKSRGKYRVYNFGFHGYGPHQMLSALESGWVEKVIACRPTHAIYQTGVYHARRSAGRYQWDDHGPRYVLKQDGSVQLEGHFDDFPVLDDKVQYKLIASRVYKRLYHWYYKPTDADLDLLVATVTQSNRWFKEHYPQLEFHVLIWGKAINQKLGRILVGLVKSEIPFHRIIDIIPDLPKRMTFYKIKHDGHPTPITYELIADYIVKNILKTRDSK